MLLLHVSASRDHFQGENLKTNTVIKHAVKTCACMDLEYSVVTCYKVVQLLYMDMIAMLRCYNILKNGYYFCLILLCNQTIYCTFILFIVHSVHLLYIQSIYYTFIPFIINQSIYYTFSPFLYNKSIYYTSSQFIIHSFIY